MYHIPSPRKSLLSQEDAIFFVGKISLSFSLISLCFEYNTNLMCKLLIVRNNYTLKFLNVTQNCLYSIHIKQYYGDYLTVVVIGHG